MDHVEIDFLALIVGNVILKFIFWLNTFQHLEHVLVLLDSFVYYNCLTTRHVTVTWSHGLSLVPESYGGKRLLRRCDLKSGVMINCLFRVRCQPSLTEAASKDPKWATLEKRQTIYFAKCECCVISTSY